MYNTADFLLPKMPVISYNKIYVLTELPDNLNLILTP